jgi:hypothetical protein
MMLSRTAGAKLQLVQDFPCEIFFPALCALTTALPEPDSLSNSSRAAFALASWLAFLLCGCVTSPTAPSFQNAPAPRVRLDVAILYIIRDSAVPYAYPGYVDIDGIKTVNLAQRGFTWLYLPPGEHAFSHYWPALAAMPKVDFKRTVVAGRTYVFEMKGKVAGRTISTELQVVDLKEAENHMALCCRYTAPVVSSDAPLLDEFKNILPGR